MANGVLVCSDDSTALVEKAVELLKHPATCRCMGEVAWQTGKERFSLERMGVGYERVYMRMGPGMDTKFQA